MQTAELPPPAEVVKIKRRVVRRLATNKREVVRKTLDKLMENQERCEHFIESLFKNEPTKHLVDVTQVGDKEVYTLNESGLKKLVDLLVAEIEAVATGIAATAHNPRSQ